MFPRGPTASLLAAVDVGALDALFPLQRGTTVVEELTGLSPGRSALHRWRAEGIAGVKLQTVTVGRVQMTTRRWLIEWFAAVDAARGEVGAS